MQLVGWNAVVAAQRFNPSTMSQLWLLDHGIVDRHELDGRSIFMPEMVQVQTSRYGILMLPELLQFATNSELENEGALIVEKLGGMVRAMPEINYTATGLNFTWTESISTDAVSDTTRQMFFKPESALFALFDRADAHFGGYMSKGFHGLRLKLDVKPVIIGAGEKKENRIAFLYNFHKDISPEDSVDQILAVLQLWDEAKAEAFEIATTATREFAI
jgi:hypothetical protein